MLPKHLLGFTLIELLVVLTIFSVLMSMSFPLLTHYNQQKNDDVLASAIINKLEITQQTALAKHENVHLYFDDINKAHKGVLHWRTYPSYREYLLFKYRGGMLSDNATIWYCHQNAALPVWAIVLDKLGSVRKIVPDKSGKIKNGQGKPIEC